MRLDKPDEMGKNVKSIPLNPNELHFKRVLNDRVELLREKEKS